MVHAGGHHRDPEVLQRQSLDARMLVSLLSDFNPRLLAAAHIIQINMFGKIGLELTNPGSMEQKWGNW